MATNGAPVSAGVLFLLPTFSVAYTTRVLQLHWQEDSRKSNWCRLGRVKTVVSSHRYFLVAETHMLLSRMWRKTYSAPALNSIKYVFSHKSPGRYKLAGTCIQPSTRVPLPVLTASPLSAIEDNIWIRGRPWTSESLVNEWPA